MIFYGGEKANSSSLAWHLSIGNIGLWLATGPLGLAVAAFGFNFVARAGCVAGFLIACGFVLTASRHQKERINLNRRVIKQTEGRRGGLLLALLSMALPYASVITIFTVWVNLYLSDAYEFSQTQVGLFLSVFALGLIVSPLLGQALKRAGVSERLIVSIFIFVGAAAMICLGIGAYPPTTALFLLGLVSLSNGHLPILWKSILRLASTRIPDQSFNGKRHERVGITVALASCSAMIVTGALQSAAALVAFVNLGSDVRHGFLVFGVIGLIGFLCFTSGELATKNSQVF